MSRSGEIFMPVSALNPCKNFGWRTKIIFWGKIWNTSISPRQEVWWSERKGEGGKRVLNYQHSSEASISNSFLSRPVIRKSDWVSNFDSIWVTVLFSPLDISASTTITPHTHTLCTYPRANKDGSVTEHKDAVKTSAELRTSSVSLASFPLPPHSLFQRLCLSMNPC